jgi:hypothetical protein
MWRDTRPELKTTHSAACIKPTTARTAASRYFGCEICAFQTSKTTLAWPIFIYRGHEQSQRRPLLRRLWKEAMKYDSYR